MNREIDILLEAIQNNRAVVEKETNVLWSKEDLFQARTLDEYEEFDELTLPAEETLAVTSIYPGCLQMGAASGDYARYRVIGQTRHFLIFAKLEA